MVETDSPYLTPHPFRGKINEPARIALTAAKLAEIRSLDIAEFAEISTRECPSPFQAARSPKRYEADSQAQISKKPPVADSHAILTIVRRNASIDKIPFFSTRRKLCSSL